MLELIVNQTSVCVTSNLLGRLKEIINNPSPAVIEFFSNGFRTTEQLEGPRPLIWNGEDEELFIDVPSAYLTNETLQSLVDKAQANPDQEENKGEAEPEDPVEMAKAEVVNGFVQYQTATVERIVPTLNETNEIKQVEAKLLDFDWIFTGDNAKTFLSILSETENDEIFSCDQIRVFVEFMWKYYYVAIRDNLFIPYLAYFFTFIFYASIFADDSDLFSGVFDAKAFCKIVSIGLFSVLWIYLAKYEFTQFFDEPSAYFTSFWNFMDLFSLLFTAVFVMLDVTNAVSVSTNNVVGSVAVLLLWMKLFYWLRIYKQFSSFIRMISEIVYDIRIFTVMLVLCLAAFANCIIVLQNNREITGTSEDPIFDPYTGWEPFDAMIHAYLTGLGDFNKDYYSEQNRVFMWIFFLIATVIVQLIFMNMLIALMGSSYEKINGILQQSTLKELCIMMTDNLGLLQLDQLFKDKRYILWLTPGGAQVSGTIVERQIA